MAISGVRRKGSTSKGRLSGFSRSASSSLRLGAIFLQKHLWVWPLIALALLVFLATWVRWQLEEPMKDQLRSQLSTILNADVAALRLWLSHQNDYLEDFAEDGVLRDAALELTAFAQANPGDTMGLLNAASHSPLQERFAARKHPELYNGYLLMDMDAKVLASNSPELVGNTPYDKDANWLKTALAGKSAVSEPFTSVILLPDSKGELRSGVPTMFVAGPVHDNDGRQIAVFGIRLLPKVHFERILNLAQVGGSGETYALNKNGLMISQSRFDASLKQLGLLADDSQSISMLSVEVRDPGVDLTQGERPAHNRSEQPLTLMAQDVTSGKTGVNVDGYRDYRGVAVVGAWTWLDDFGFGVATEIDVAEAFQPLFILRRIFWGLYALVALAAVAIFIFSIAISRLQRIARSAVLEAKNLGQYTIDDKIGAGGMGVVYRAHHQLLRRPTAVKLLNTERTTSDSIARFEREVTLTSQLSHPNTITILDYGHTPEGVFYYAMELLDGLDLQQLVERFGPQPEGRTIHILRQVCGSLAEAHAAGLVHRDIKPANIMLTQQGGIDDFVKVLDFGLVRAIDSGRAGNLTAANAWAGSPSYMSPEAITTPGEIDARTDIFAVGAVAYFLLTGEALFKADSLQALLRKQATGEIDPPSKRLGKSIARDLEAVVMACLAHAPNDRPASSRVLGRMLLGCSDAASWTDESARAWWETYRGRFAQSTVINEVETGPQT